MRKELLELRDHIDLLLAAEEAKAPAEITFENSVYGDLIFERKHDLPNGHGIYQMRDAIPYREFDAANIADYSVADINQWLTSDAPAGKWWKDLHGKGKRPSYFDTPGFLYGFKPEDLAKLQPTENGLFFLPSFTEVTGQPNGNLGMEGELWSAYEGAWEEMNKSPYACDRLKKKIIGTNEKAWWWLRSCVPDASNCARGVGRGGYADVTNFAYNRGDAVAPACVI